MVDRQHGNGIIESCQPLAMPVCSKCPHGVTDSAWNILPEHRGRAYESLPCSTCSLRHGFESDQASSIYGDNNRNRHGQSILKIQDLGVFRPWRNRERCMGINRRMNGIPANDFPRDFSGWDGIAKPIGPYTNSACPPHPLSCRARSLAHRQPQRHSLRQGNTQVQNVQERRHMGPLRVDKEPTTQWQHTTPRRRSCSCGCRCQEWWTSGFRFSSAYASRVPATYPSIQRDRQWNCTTVRQTPHPPCS